ncbi:MAG: hypothetical protein R3F11_22840 [Verrucomicrobiales bacterium]
MGGELPEGPAHSTPVIAAIAGVPADMVNASNALQGAGSGGRQRICGARAKGDASPAFGEGVVFSTARARRTRHLRVDPTGKGEVTATHLRWSVPQYPEGLSSPIIQNGRVWRTHGPEILKAFDLKTGD